MKPKHTQQIGLALLVGMFLTFLTSCQTANPTNVPATPIPPAANTLPAPEPTQAQLPAKDSKVGGTLVLRIPAEPGTLDPHIASESVVEAINTYIGASLVAKDPTTGDVVPYLAESWTVSDDGLVLDFTLRQDVKFHNGKPFTAADYAYTFQRALDPETKATVARFLLNPLAKAEAIDPTHLRLTLNQPYATFISMLADPGYMMPLSKEAIETAGSKYSHNPVGAGPYKLKEWKTGDRIVLERNPDYNWGPSFRHEGPAYIEFIEFRVIPEDATALAGLEAGEVDLLDITAQNLERIKETGRNQIFSGTAPGMSPYVLMNLSKPPFDNLLVRQAFNLAINKDALIKVATMGNAIPQGGPLSPSVIGYWSEIEKLAYSYNLDEAKALMSQAGYVVGNSGILEKDGVPLSLTMKILPLPDAPVVAQVLQAQYKDLGVDIKLEQGDPGVIFPSILMGNFELALHGVGWPDADVLYLAFHSSGIGATNFCQLNDPELDVMLNAERTTIDPVKRQEVVNNAQKYIVEQAYAVPLYANKTFMAVNNRIQGVTFSQLTGIDFGDAYIGE
jgi:peptide/nickel transport system substrate-binding protein